MRSFSCLFMSSMSCLVSHKRRDAHLRTRSKLHTLHQHGSRPSVCSLLLFIPSFFPFFFGPLSTREQDEPAELSLKNSGWNVVVVYTSVTVAGSVWAIVVVVVWSYLRRGSLSFLRGEGMLANNKRLGCKLSLLVTHTDKLTGQVPPDPGGR